MKTAVIVIDLINELTTKQGKLTGYLEHVEKNKVIQHASKVINFAKSKKMPVIFVKMGFTKNYIDCPMSSPLLSSAKAQGAFAKESWGTEIHPALPYDDNDPCIYKTRISAFYGTELDIILRNAGVTHVVLMGVSTENAIQAAARDAHDRDYRITIIKNGCGSSSNEMHEASLKLLSKFTKQMSCAEFCSEQ